MEFKHQNAISSLDGSRGIKGLASSVVIKVAGADTGMNNKFKTLEFEFENQLPWNIHGECLNNTYQRFLGPREVKLFGI